jgi:hypothetical protein
MIGEGLRVRFVPVSAINNDQYHFKGKKDAVDGKIVYINWQHKYFTAEYDCCGSKQKESFQFCDIGKAVTIIG